MSLPDRLKYTWNAADITEDVIKIGERPAVFVETRGGDFPPALLLRLLGARAVRRSTFTFLDASTNQQTHIQFKDIKVSGELHLHPRFQPEDSEPYVVSSTPPPHTTMDGDVRFYLDKTTS